MTQGGLHARSGRVIEVDSLTEFDDLVHRGASSMRGWRVQDLDLRDRERALLGFDGAGGVLLGCDLTARSRSHLVASGALIFDDIPHLPFNAYRTRLYSAAELLAGPAGSYAASLDARIYAWSRANDQDVARSLASTMHDHSIDVALAQWVRGRRIVGVMGGHALRRDSAEYRDAALLGRNLALAGLTVATGGGPGAMEAANLGARCASVPEAMLDRALATLAQVPDFTSGIDEWYAVAIDVASALPDGDGTLGIPTWHYGHEPPAAFATAIAKYFQNSVREDILLRVANGGLIVMPGAGGTVQEIFQDACENSYADEASWTPMVLVGREFWTETLPAWQLLTKLMQAKPASRGLALADSPADATAQLLALQRAAPSHGCY